MEKIITVLSLIILIGLSGLMIYSWWVLYDKMGEKGWICLIPFYGRFVLFKRVWEGKIYFISLIFGVIAFLSSGLSSSSLLIDLAANGAALMGTGGLLIFAIIFSMISFAMQMMLNWRMVKCFGRGFGVFLGLTFLPIIFLPILAIGRASYDYY